MASKIISLIKKKGSLKNSTALTYVKTQIHNQTKNEVCIKVLRNSSLNTILWSFFCLIIFLSPEKLLREM